MDPVAPVSIFQQQLVFISKAQAYDATCAIFKIPIFFGKDAQNDFCVSLAQTFVPPGYDLLTGSWDSSFSQWHCCRLGL